MVMESIRFVYLPLVTTRSSYWALRHFSLTIVKGPWLLSICSTFHCLWVYLWLLLLLRNYYATITQLLHAECKTLLRELLPPRAKPFLMCVYWCGFVWKTKVPCLKSGLRYEDKTGRAWFICEDTQVNWYLSTISFNCFSCWLVHSEKLSNHTLPAFLSYRKQVWGYLKQGLV